MNDAPRAPSVVAAAVTVLAIVAFGAWSAAAVTAEGLTGPLRSSLNVFFDLFAGNEPAPLAVLGAFALAALALALRPGAATATDVARTTGVPLAASWPALTPRRSWLLACVVALVALAGQRWVMHGFALSMDEFNTGFEAAILATGRVFAPIRDEWIAFVPAVKPVFVVWRGDDHSWYSGYVPVYAALRAALRVAHLELWLNPLCAGVSVVLAASIARRLRPADDRAPLIAALALVASAQFLVTSATQYTMPAHLAANLLWLWLALRDDKASWVGAALLGGLALGLHNPFPHALFVVPFLWRWLRRREYARLALTLVVYALFAALWLAWLRMERSGAPGGGGMLSLFTVPRLENWRLNGMNLVLMLSWQAPIVALLLPLAFIGERVLVDAERDLARGVLLTFLFYVLYGNTQGHGWGYRYVYGVLGSVALLAVPAMQMLAGRLGERRAARLFGAGCAVSLAALAPLRMFQAERFVRPFAAASAHLAAMDADVVAVETAEVWYGRDLVRNDPWLSRPVIVNGSLLNGLGWAALHEKYGDRLKLMRADELVALGMQRVSPRAMP